MSIDLTPLMVKPIAEVPDTYSFQWDFVPEGKALETGGTQTVTENENGDLIIEGYAAVFEGNDRQGENFTDGAFQRGVKSFLGGQSALCFHHKHHLCLGKVTDLEEVEGKGLRLRARVDGAIKTHPEMGTYYHQIKNGTLNALSIGGIFKRKLTPEGYKISDCDFTEISVTPVPVHPGTHFSVVAGKALVSDVVGHPAVDHKLPIDKNAELRDSDVEALSFHLQGLGELFDRLGSRKTTDNSSDA